MLKGMINTKHDRTRMVLFSIFLIVFFYMLVFNLGYLPYFPLARAQYGPTCGADGLEAGEDCDPGPPMDWGTCECWEKCGLPGWSEAGGDPADECKCYDFRPLMVECDYYDNCPGAGCAPCGDPGVNPGDLCENDDCWGVEEALCMDADVGCHETFSCPW